MKGKLFEPSRVPLIRIRLFRILPYLEPKTTCLGFALKVAQQFSHTFLLMRFSTCTTIAKTNMPSIQRSLFCSMPATCLLFFFVIGRSVLMALVFYYKGMLEKVTMQTTQQFSDLSKEPS